MAGNTDGNIMGTKPVVGSKSDRMSQNTIIALLKRLINQSGLGGYTFGFAEGFDVLNEKSSAKIGYFEDNVVVPFEENITSILGFLDTAYHHAHGTSFVYPNHANDVLLTAGSGAWDLTGAIIEVVPANILNISDFDIHWLNVTAISANGLLQIDMYKGESGSEVLIGATKPFRNAVQSQEGPRRVQIPQQLKNERISCKLSDSSGGAITCTVSVEGHYYTII